MKRKKPNIVDVPSEMFYYHIFRYLRFKEILVLASVSKMFEILCYNKQAWKSLLLSEFNGGEERVESVRTLFPKDIKPYKFFKCLWKSIPIIQDKHIIYYKYFRNFIQSANELERSYFITKLRILLPDFARANDQACLLSLNEFKTKCRILQQMKKQSCQETLISYIGEMVDGVREGRGVLRFQNEGIYKGSFKNNLFHGHGDITFIKKGREPDKWDKFIGHFENGMKTGYGEEFENGKIRYKGEYLENQKHGNGVYYYLDGAIYKGTFVDGMAHGNGKYQFTSLGLSYEGGFHYDKREGFGVFQYRDGSVYVGEFKDSRFCGRGRLRSVKMKCVFDGAWIYRSENDRYFEGSVTMENGTKYKGKWKNGVNKQIPELTFHLGYFCQVCNQTPIFGRIRYVCKECCEFYMCESCFKLGHHKNHQMLCIDLHQMETSQIMN